MSYYHYHNPIAERPVWSTGTAWFYEELDLRMHPELGWGFALWQDVSMITVMMS